MARTITTKASAVSTRTQDPYTQPAFAVYGSHASSHGSGFICYNHNLEIHSVFTGDSNQSYSRFRTQSGGGAPEFYNHYNNSAYMECHTQPGSGAERCNNTCNTGYLGHQNLVSPTEYSSSAGYIVADDGRHRKAQAFRDVMTIVNEENQDYAIFGHHNGGSGTLFSAGTRSAMRYYGEFSVTGIRRFNIIRTGGANHQGCYGSGCYNVKTKKLAIIEYNSSTGRLTPTVWNNVPDLRSLALNGEAQYSGLTQRSAAYSGETGGPIYQFFQNSANCTVYNTGTHNLNDYSGSDESRYRHQTVLCDNGKIVTFTMTPSNGCVVHRWNADGTYEGEVWNGTWTTSYGFGHGNRFGSRWQVTTSGKYVWAYCPSYYYGAGVYWVCIRVSDGKFIKFQSNDSTNGRASAPIGMNSMIWTYTENSDGPGLYYKIWELDYYLAILNDNQTVSLDDNYSAYILDCPTNTTNYPTIVPAMYDTSMFHNNTIPRTIK